MFPDGELTTFFSKGMGQGTIPQGRDFASNGCGVLQDHVRVI
jgi:hypothetical protein